MVSLFGSAMIELVRGVDDDQATYFSLLPESSAWSAGVELPPKLKSAVLVATACRVGAWFGNGPTHSTSMPWSLRVFSKTPRVLGTEIAP